MPNPTNPPRTKPQQSPNGTSAKGSELTGGLFTQPGRHQGFCYESGRTDLLRSAVSNVRAILPQGSVHIPRSWVWLLPF